MPGQAITATVAGNFIGTDSSGTLGLGNGDWGAILPFGNRAIFGLPNAPNTVAFNQTGGIRASFESAVTEIVHNVWYGNDGLATDVGGTGVSSQNNGTGPENFVVLSNTYLDAGDLVVEGFSKPGETFNLYISDPNLTGFGEGAQLLTTLTEGAAQDLDATTGTYSPADAAGAPVGSGNANRFQFRIPQPVGVTYGSRLTGLITTRIAEFSNSLLVAEQSQNGVAGSSLPAEIYDALAEDEFVPLSNRVLQTDESLIVNGIFYDPDSVAWSGTVDFGDGTPLQGLTLTDDFQFDLNYKYAQAGTYTVNIQVVDNTLAAGTASFTVTVLNDAPVISDNLFTLTSPLLEGETATLTGHFQDAGLTDGHSVEINWGDGTPTQSFNVGNLGRTFVATHVYDDDTDVSGTSDTPTPVDVYRVQVRVVDEFGASDDLPVGLLLAEVANVKPTNLQLNLSSATAFEGEQISLAGSFVDPGIFDTHTVMVDWGDGSRETLALAAGSTSFSGLTHTYLNNDFDNNDYEITVSVADDDEPGAVVSATQSIAVENVVPTIAAVNVVSAIDENNVVTLDVSFTDPGLLDDHSLYVLWGDSTDVQNSYAIPFGARSISGITHQYADNPANNGNTWTVNVGVFDNSGLGGFGSATAIVNNTAPVLELISVDQGQVVQEGDTVTVTGAYRDAGPQDRHTVMIDWGDGTQSPASVNSTTRTFTASHTFADNGTGAAPNFDATISATVTDDDGASGSLATSVSVVNIAPDIQILPDILSSTSQSIELDSVFTDPGTADSHTFDWQIFEITGAGSTLLPAQSTQSAVIQRTSGVDIYFVELTVTDDDGGVSTTSELLVLGTDNSETLTIDDTALTQLPAGSGVTVLAFGGADIVDATGVTSADVTLDGGAGDDTLFGGSGDDQYFLHNGDDTANVNSAGITANMAGNDRYFLIPNSTLTVVDDADANAIDFRFADFGDGSGIEFDLSSNVTNSLTQQDVYAGSNANEQGTHFVRTQGEFNEVVGSAFGDSLTGASDAQVFGGDGNG